MGEVGAPHVVPIKMESGGTSSFHCREIRQ